MPRLPSSHPWVQSYPQVLVQNAPQRTFSWGSCNTPSFSGESKHKRHAQAPASEKPARRSQMWWKSSTSFVSPTGGPSQIHLQNTLAYSRKTSSKRRGNGSRVYTWSDLPWCMESVWLPGFDSLLPLPSAGAAGAVSGNYGAWGADPQDKWSRQLPGPSLPESSPAGLAAHEQARLLDESPSLLVQARPVRCATGQESRDELLGQE